MEEQSWPVQFRHGAWLNPAAAILRPGQAHVPHAHDSIHLPRRLMCPFLPCPRNRPDGKQWLKFDDERVEKADDQKAIEDNWGGEGEAPPGGARLAAAALRLDQP